MKYLFGTVAVLALLEDFHQSAHYGESGSITVKKLLGTCGILLPIIERQRPVPGLTIQTGEFLAEA